MEAAVDGGSQIEGRAAAVKVAMEAAVVRAVAAAVAKEHHSLQTSAQVLPAKIAWTGRRWLKTGWVRHRHRRRFGARRPFRPAERPVCRPGKPRPCRRGHYV